MNTVYVLVVDKAWAKLYKTGYPPTQLTLVYHQALFGGRDAGDSADVELARSLCRLLRADRLTGKYTHLAMFASTPMLATLRIQYDGDWHDVVMGEIGDLPARYTEADLGAHLQRLLAQRSALLAETDQGQ